MEINVIILARGGSKGLPRKNILEVSGKPLIAWSIKQALDSSLVKNVYVSSDNHEILAISELYGAKSIIRPHELATDTSTSEDALKHALHYINSTTNNTTDIVVFLQPTSPLRCSQDITDSIITFIDGKYDSLFSSIHLEDFCVWTEDSGTLNSYNFDYKNRKRRQEIKKQYLENGSIYVFKPEILFKYNNRLGGKIGTYIMDKWKQFEIDNREDLELCEFYIKKYLWKD